MIQASEYKVGQTYPKEFTGRLFGPETSPEWYILTTHSQKEPNAKIWLEHHGFDVWYPTETAWRNVPRGKRRKVSYERTLCPRYIFVEFNRKPDWSLLLSKQAHYGAGGRFLTGVVCMNGTPTAIKEDVLMQMKMLPTMLDQKRKSIRDALMPRVGKIAMITKGQMQGSEMVVQSINGNVAELLSPLFGGIAIKVDVDRLENVV